MKGYRLTGIFLILALSLLAVMCSCSPRVVTVPEYHVEYRTNTVHDSIYVERRDSSATLINGDTITIEHWHVSYKDRYIEVTDTFVKRDSIPVPYAVPAKLTRWQTFCCDYGIMMLGGSLVSIFLILLYIYRWARKLRKQ